MNADLLDSKLTKIDTLRDALSELKTNDPLLRSFAELPVMRHAFFPGGNGLYQGIEATRLPVDGVLILGSNFGSSNNFVNDQNELLLDDERNVSRTWKKLLPMLADSGIDQKECFFTNAWPFLHIGGKNTGPVENWLKNSVLMFSCAFFLKQTLEIIRPRLIVGLGTGPVAFLGHVFPEELSVWKGYRISCMDELPIAQIGLPNSVLDCVCVAITHPSMPNVRHRILSNRDEVRLLSHAYSLSVALGGN